MSKISLEPNASGAGTFTLAAPNSNTNRTLTLPDEDGTVLSNAIIGTGPDQIPTNSIVPGGYTDQDALDLFNVTGSAPVFACRAWVNFDGNGPTIRDSGNVSSITDNGTGDYTVNFATAMSDANYAVTAICDQLRPGDTSQNRSIGVYATGSSRTQGSLTTTSVRLMAMRHGNAEDFEHVSVSVFR